MLTLHSGAGAVFILTGSATFFYSTYLKTK